MRGLSSHPNPSFLLFGRARLSDLDIGDKPRVIVDRGLLIGFRAWVFRVLFVLPVSWVARNGEVAGMVDGRR